MRETRRERGTNWERSPKCGGVLGRVDEDPKSGGGVLGRGVLVEEEVS